MKFIVSFLLSLCLFVGSSGSARAIILVETGDVTRNTTTPGDNSGWQYEGSFGGFLGVPIAPFFFITAAHIGGSSGDVFTFHGDPYTTIASQGISGTDLRIWEVNHLKPFPTYAPLCTGTANIDLGANATIIGRGTQRGAAITIPEVSGVLKGWEWGTSDSVQRWGRNVIVGVSSLPPAYGELIYCDFDRPGVQDECALSVGDSGGGLFVLENGLWRLAGISYLVDGGFRIPPAGPPLTAPVFDLGGFEYESSPGVWTLIPDTPTDVPSSFYCTRVSAYLHRELPEKGILDIIGTDGSLSPESFSAWQKLYFTPAQIAAPATTGALADFDSDGISNLMEFALNIEPIFNAQTTMTATTGLSGLPLVRLENISGADHVTIEFVRRTAGSGSGLTYMPQFSSDLTTWQAVGAVTVTAINSRWERVKVVDPETTITAGKRLARLNVTLAN